MGAVKPSPGNPYLQRRSRHGTPLTQNVAPFRSSVHSVPEGQPPPAGQLQGPGPPRPGGVRESQRTPQGGFHRPVGRGHPLVRMPRNPPPGRQSFRGRPLSPQPSLKQQGDPLSPQHSVRRPSSPHHPQHKQPSSPLPPRAPSPFRSFSPASFRSPHNPSLPHHSQVVTQYNHTMEPGASPLLTNADLRGANYTFPEQRPTSPDPSLRYDPRSSPLQNSYLRNTSYSSPVRRGPSPSPGGQLMTSYVGRVSQGSLPQPSNASYSSPLASSPLQRNASLYTPVLSPYQTRPPRPLVNLVE